MRHKDEEKRNAIIKATVKLVNETGFVSASVSKIAKEANVSPATLYIYYKNKEDLLVSTYIDIKKEMSRVIMKDFNAQAPLKDVLRKLWINIYTYIKSSPENVWFADQFSNSPYSNKVNREEIEAFFQPVSELFLKAIEDKVIKDVPFDVLGAFIFYPVMRLSNSKLCIDFKLDINNMDTVFEMSWDAIKM